MSAAEPVSGSTRLPDEERLLVLLAESFGRTGMDATGILELLSAWLSGGFQVEPGSGRFRAKLTEHGIDPERVKVIIQSPARFPHREEVPPHYAADTAARMDAVRREVQRLLDAEIAPALPPGKPHDRNVSGTQVKRDADAIKARLKRDDPDLAERVVRGEITPNAAAHAKGWRKPRVVLTSPASVDRSLAKHFTDAELLELAELLYKRCGRAD